MSRRRLLAPVLVAMVLSGAGYGVDAALTQPAEPAPAAPLGPGEVTVHLGIEHSVFEADEIRVVPGTRVRFVVDNGDPIAHELIVGDEAVHARHEAGTHGVHPAVAGEVSVGPNRSGVTTFRFDDPGVVEFACHLPRHFDFGMHGQVVVVPAE